MEGLRRSQTEEDSDAGGEKIGKRVVTLKPGQDDVNREVTS